MNRLAIEGLLKWKNTPNHKPLIIKGARQVGKTWLMKEFGQKYYKNFVYINFEDDEFINNIFEQDFDIDRIIETINIRNKVKIDTETLLIFDEIQSAPKGVTALKYFQEKAPEYDIISAGSLLGVGIHPNASFPVGKVDFLELYPMNFCEFLDALGENDLLNLIINKKYDLISSVKDKFEILLKKYYYVGGMPEAVKIFIETQDFEYVRKIQNNILETYDKDFSKHAPIKEVPRIRLIWKSIIAQLSKENKKFIYGFLKKGARAKDFELALEWLKDAGLIYKVNRIKSAHLPLSAYEDFSAFKIFMLDIGLTIAMCKLPSEIIIDGDKLFQDYKGALTEQYVLQQINFFNDTDIFYWSNESNTSEIDFIIQQRGKIIPIEVKASENLQSKSLYAFIKKNPELHGIRFSMSLYREQDWLTNIPLYCVDNF
ncbi:MAG: ATP-binding protein [Bacteroidales bacterium]|nr:ATP-binding protein [Bacteroidales bacterium]